MRLRLNLLPVVNTLPSLVLISPEKREMQFVKFIAWYVVVTCVKVYVIWVEAPHLSHHLAMFDGYCSSASGVITYSICRVTSRLCKWGIIGTEVVEI